MRMLLASPPRVNPSPGPKGVNLSPGLSVVNLSPGPSPKRGGVPVYDGAYVGPSGRYWTQAPPPRFGEGAGGRG
jgi:hypothetical protein